MSNSALSRNLEMVLVGRLRPQNNLSRPASPHNPELTLFIQKLETCNLFVNSWQFIKHTSTSEIYHSDLARTAANYDNFAFFIDSSS
jgi:hypothetical protein